MPAAKKPAVKKVWDRKTVSAKSDSLRKTNDDYAAQAKAANTVEGQGKNISKRFAQSMDSTRKAFNKRADEYAIGITRQDSAQATDALNKLKKSKSPAAALGGELTPIKKGKKGNH